MANQEWKAPEWVAACAGESHLMIEADGMCEPRNPGGVAVAAWIIRRATGSPIGCGSAVIADGGKWATNNVAEYSAVGRPLGELLKAGWHGRVDVRTDSQLVVNQINGEWNCNKEHLIKLRDRVLELFAAVCGVDWSIAWWPREKNEAADHEGRECYRRYCKAVGRPHKFSARRVDK